MDFVKFEEKNSKVKKHIKNSSPAGLEPALPKGNGLAGHRVNHSAKTKVFGYRPGNNSSAFNVSTHEGAGTFQALANKELTSPKANWASRL
ncbi:hypothetical protein H8356DRAFT_1425171 [Neocallimastix lanati (nom. inval.)]|nr:hypothetical protein H8356DRAFT_1425171 [Neocallimastix sp. JGI-2020a]